MFSVICRPRHLHETTEVHTWYASFLPVYPISPSRPIPFRPNALGLTVLGSYVLSELLFEPELVATDTKISHIHNSSTPAVHSPVLTVNREPKVILVEMPKGVFRILKLHTCLKGAQ